MAQHNWTTNSKVIDSTEDRQTLDSICSTNHLTPASEAAMDNLIHPGSESVPTREEIIKRNSPGFETDELTEPSWRDDEPTAEAYEPRAVR